MKKSNNKNSRRKFIQQSSLAMASFTIVPRYVLGGTNITPPSDKINIGFIGTGKQSGGLASNFLKIDEIQVVAASDVFESKVDAFQKKVNDHYAEAAGTVKYKGCDTYENYKKLLKRKDIDAVIIATPDHWHAINIIDSIKAGKDVYCEKPLTHNILEGRAVVNATKKYNKVLQTGSMQRSWPAFRDACEMVRSGHIGEIKRVLVNVGDPAVPYDLPTEPTPKDLNWDMWLGPAPELGYNYRLAPTLDGNFFPDWRDYEELGGGIISDWGAHMFDIAQWGLGMDDTGPIAIIPPKNPRAVRGLKFIYQNGVEMFHEDFGRGFGVRFEGSTGVIDVSRQYLESLPTGLIRSKMDDDKVTLYRNENHYQDWIDCIKSRKDPICPAEIGHRSASICHLANIAYDLHRPLKWDPKKEVFDNDEEANKMRGRTYREKYQLPVV
ncbi:MAG: Gfo/Idh/MocA family oxidoreductase [Cyclobacteriaceae bacterium]